MGDSMSFVIKGFPTEISDYIELPDIAELLMYPIFFDTPIEIAYKYGTDFQRKLIDMTPLRHTKKYITVLSEVRLLDKYNRSCTNFNSYMMNHPENEWHIDCEENEDKTMTKIFEETDMIHLLTSKATSMTEFNKNEIKIDKDLTYDEFYQFIRKNKHLIIPQKMPHNRIVTFTNHLHRATPSQRIEFKYMFRVVETDRKRPPSNPTYNKDFITTIINLKGEKEKNVKREYDKTIIFIPSSMKKDYLKYNFRCELKNNDKNINDEIETLIIHEAHWENTGVSKNSEVYLFTPKNSIMLISKHYDFHDPLEREKLKKFFKEVNKEVNLINLKTGEIIKANLSKSFCESYGKNDFICGTFIQLTKEQAEKIKKGDKYKIKFNESSKIRYTTLGDLIFEKNREE